SELAHQGVGRLPPDVLVYAVEGPFFFAAVDAFERALAETHTDPSAIIIRLGNVPFMDATGLQVLEDTVLSLQTRGVRVMLTEANGRVHAKLAKMGLIERLGSGNVLPTVGQAVAQLTHDSRSDSAQDI